MRLTIDTDARVLTEETPEGSREIPLYSPEAFSLLNRQWVRVGWSQRYSYGFAWFGRPVIQLPEDIVRIQEIIHRVQPDVIVETGVAHGGSLIFYAGLCKALGRGRVIGVDIEIRPHNRAAIEAHPLGSLITLIEGELDRSADRRAACRGLIGPDERVLVLLDSNHTKAHVLAESTAYAPLVSPDPTSSRWTASWAISSMARGASRSGNGTTPARRRSSSQPLTRDSHSRSRRFPSTRARSDERVTYWPSAYLRRLPGV